MGNGTNRSTPRSWRAVCGTGLGLSLAYALVPERYTVFREFAIYNVVSVGSWVAVFIGIRRYRPRAPLAWTLIAVALLAWSIGDIIWSAYDVAGAEVPYPSAADLFYLAGYPLFAAGFYASVRARRIEHEWKVVLDAVAVTLAGLLVMWVYVMQPVLDEPGASRAAKVISVLYPSGDLLLTGFAGLVFLGTSWHSRSMQLLMAGFAGTLAGDIAYYRPPSVHGLGVGDAVYLVALTCFALAALHPSMRALTDPSDERTLDSRRRLALFGVVLALPLIVITVQATRDEPLYLWASIGCGVVLIVLALLRFDRTLVDRKRSEGDARTLSRFSGELLGAEDDAQLVATADGVVGELVRQGSAHVVEPPEPPGTPHAFVAPVTVDGVPVAEVVADVGPRELDAVDGPLTSVASQLALALERTQGLRREQEMVESLREQNEQLAELDRMKNRFVSSTSHELRTPLTSMVGYLELLLGGEAGELNEEQRHFLEIVNRNCDRLNRLVDDVLFVGRADSDRLTLEPTDVDVAELVRAEVASQEAVARLKGLDLRCEVQAGDLPTITGDTTRLTQLLDNLLSNATKFTPAGGAVIASVAGDAAQIRVAVSDSGVGIPPDELPRIFERFFRASTSAVAPGTGLGLPIVQTIAEAHGGKVSAASELGIGTTFTVELPVNPALDTLIMRATREKEAATT